jgi:hypothetical protein
MALPAAVAVQLTALNAALTKMVANRDMIISLFDDRLGASTYSLLTVQNEATAKNAIVTDMGVARDSITSVINALAAM